MEALWKKVSKLGLLTMSIGGMIGWGAFMQPGIKFLPQVGVLNTTSFALIFKNVVFSNSDFITLYTVAGAPVTLVEVLMSIGVIAVFSWFMLKGYNQLLRCKTL